MWEMKQHHGSWEDVKSTSLISALEICQSQQIPVIEVDKLKVCVISAVRRCACVHVRVCVYLSLYVCVLCVCMMHDGWIVGVVE